MKSNLAIHGGDPVVPQGLKRRWPEITAEDKAAVMAVLDSGELTGVQAPNGTALEAEWAAYVGVKHASLVNSGTAALHCAMFAAGVGPGVEVITTAFTFSGTFQAILHQNGIPIFVDIDPGSYNIDPKLIEARITEKTKVIMPVHIHGLPCDMDEIMAIAKKHNLLVVEDSAQAQGATYKGRPAGTIGDMGCTSLQATKNLAGAEGGLVYTDDDELHERVRLVRTYGERSPRTDMGGWYFRPYTVYTVGWNYRSHEMPAALARGQLKRLDHYNHIGQRNAQYLAAELSKIPGLTPPYVPPDRTSVYHKYRVRFDPTALGIKAPAGEFRDKLMTALVAEGVSGQIWHKEIMPAFPIFQSHEAYGQGCPWSCPFYGKDIKYDPAEYPVANRLLETSVVINDEPNPIFIQPLELMHYYVEAFKKVLADPEKILS